MFPASAGEKEKLQTEFRGVHEMVDGLKTRIAALEELLVQPTDN